MEEFEALRLNFTKMALQQDELKSRVDKWLTKKRFVYRKVIMAAYLKA